MGVWADLSSDLLDRISEKLSVPDLLRFEAVCPSWQSAVRERRRRHPPPPHHQSPWLMFSGHEYSGGDPSAASFFSLSERTVYTIDLPAPAIRGRMWIGSAHGWLVTADSGWELSLLNPITREQIHLPPLARFDGVDPPRDAEGRITQFVLDPLELRNRRRKQMKMPPRRVPAMVCGTLYLKAVLSSSPSAGDYIVMVLLFEPRHRLAFLRSWDLQWRLIDSPLSYRDIVYHKGQFFTVTWNGIMESWDFSGTSPKPTLVMPEPPPGITRFYYFYLVSAPWGELLHVWREREGSPAYDCRTRHIRVDRVDLEKKKLIEMDSLSDYCLFLGGNLSTCLSSRDIPQLKENCVYFTDERWEVNWLYPMHQRDMGIYNLKDGSIEPILPMDPRLYWPPPIWVMPRLS